MPDTYFDLLAAYGAVWGLIVFFVVRLVRDQGRLAGELERLKSSADGTGDGRAERIARAG